MKIYRDYTTIDPGYSKKGKGCACVETINFELYKWWFVRPDEVTRGYAPTTNIVVIEKPTIDGRTPHPGHILELGWQGASVANRYAGIHGIVVEKEVNEWKQSQHKPQQHHEMWQGLSCKERKLLGGEVTRQAIEMACEKGASCSWSAKVDWYPRSFLMHNVLDAAALSLVYSGRLR